MLLPSASRLGTVVATMRGLAEAGLDEPKILESLTENLGRQMGQHCSVRLVSDDGRRWVGGTVFEDGAHRSLGRELFACDSSPEGGDELAGVMQRGSSFWGPTAEATSELLRGLDLEQILCVPLKAGESLQGVLTVGRRAPLEAAFDAEDVAHAEIVAAHAALLLSHARAIRTARREKEELESAERHLERFSHAVSHDLRAPLRAIDGFCRILIEDHSGELGAEGRRLANVVSANAVKMGRLIDDLLDWSRAGRRSVRKRHTNVTSLARRAVDAMLAAEGERELVVELDDLPESACDPALIERVFALLLHNAARYTRQTPAARIAVRGTRDAQFATYLVQDNGVGFDERFAGKLFGVFQRLHVAPELEGTGVGLALVERLVELHGGRVFAEGELGRGATFGFTLPLLPDGDVARGSDPDDDG